MSISENPNIFKPSYYKGDGLKKTDLLLRLNELHKKLATVSQDDRPRGLKEISSHLVTKGFLNHADKDLRLIVLCCLADVFRIYAPEAPFCDPDMLLVFEGFVMQLRSLSTNKPESATGTKICYILNSLSTVKSCVVPVILSQAGLQGAPEVVTGLFDALLSCVSADYSENVLENICSILQSCIEESTELDSELLDVLLTPLLPTSKTDNPVAYKIIENVFRHVAAHIEPSLSKYLNQILIGANVGETPEIAENVYPIIYELHKISPELLNRVLPNICLQLETEDDEIRLRAVKLVGRLFASKNANYGVEFGRNFKEFLNRFSDLSVDVRSEMIEIGALIMSRQPHLFALVEEGLCKRLRDLEAKVRTQALTKLLEMASDDITVLRVETLIEIGHRVKDKKPDIVTQALVGISKLYAKYLSSQLPGIDTLHPESATSSEVETLAKRNDKDKKKNAAVLAFDIRKVVRPEIFERCQFIPSLVINCWGYPDTPTRHMVTQVLQELILPKAIRTSKAGTDSQIGSQSQNQSTEPGQLATIDSVRATALLLLYDILSDADRNSLGAILGAKTKLRVELDQFFEASKNVQLGSSSGRSSSDPHLGDGSDGETEDVSVPLKRSVLHILQLVPPIDKSRSPSLEKIASMKDKHVMRLFEHAVSPTDTITESIRAREDLMQRLESKSVLGIYSGYLFDIAGFLFANSGMLQALLRHLLALKRMDGGSVQASDKYSSHIGIILLFAKHASPVFRNCCPLLQQLLSIATTSVTTESTLINTLSVVLKHTAAVIAKEKEISPLCTNLMAAIDRLGDQTTCEQYTEALLRIELHCEFNDASDEKGSKLSRADWDRLSKQRRTLVSQHERTGTVFTSKYCVANIIKNLTEKDKLSLSNPNLIHDLRILSTLFRVPTVITSGIDYRYPYSTMIAPVYELRRERILEFLHGSILCPSFLSSADRLPSLTAKGSDGNKRAHRPSDGSASNDKTVIEQYVEIFDTVCGALQLWSALSGAEEEIKQWVETKYNMNFHLYDDDYTGELSSRQSSDTGSTALLAMLEVLFSCIYSDGTCVGDVYLHSALETEAQEMSEGMDGPTSDIALLQQRATLHSLVERVADTATLCVINLLHLKAVGNHMPAEHWKRLGWRFLDANPTFRQRLIEEYLSLIQTHAIHPRFLAFVCLLATDDRYGKYAETVLQFSMKRLRKTHENLNSRILMYSASAARGDDASLGGSEVSQQEGRQNVPKNSANLARLKKLALINMPETVMPYVLYLLSYHPEFPTTSTLDDESDKKKAQRIMHSLRLVVTTLLNSLSRDANNLAYLLKQTNTLVQYHVDRQDPGNIGIHFVSRMVIQILKENIRTAESLQAYPGEISLPMDLYLHKKTSKLDVDNSYLRNLLAFDVAENNQETFEKVFTEKVMKKGGKQAGKKLLSPVGTKQRPAAKAAPRRAIPQSRHSLEDSTSDDEKDEVDDDNYDGGNKKRKFKVTGNIEEDDDEDIRLKALVTIDVNATSNRPARAARARVNYREADESDREVEKWESELARQELDKKRLSIVSEASNKSGIAKASNIAGYFAPKRDASQQVASTQSSAGGSSLSSNEQMLRLSGGKVTATKDVRADNTENVPRNKTSKKVK